MKQSNSVQALLGHTDIYLVDQIMKGRYAQNDLILDAGCGGGRNMHWFIQNGFRISGIDPNAEAIYALQAAYPHIAGDLSIGSIEENVFADDRFHHIICSAVLHFANSTEQFKVMLAAIVRIVKPGGTIFIRMTSDIGIEDKITALGNGVFLLPDGSQRFLLTRTLLAGCMLQHKLLFAEPVKTTNVDDLRCMSTLLLQKQPGG